MNRVGCTLPYPRMGRRKRECKERGILELSRCITWSSTVGEGEEGLGVVRNDHHPLAERVFTVGGANKALELNVNRAIDIGTRLDLKIHERGEGAVKPRRNGVVLKVGTEECITDFLKRFAVGKRY